VLCIGSQIEPSRAITFNPTSATSTTRALRVGHHPSCHLTTFRDTRPRILKSQTLTGERNTATMSDQEREHALASFKAKLIESREWEAKLKNLRVEIKGLQKEFDQTEENIKALQSVGQIIGEVLKQLDDERCACSHPLSPAPNGEY
jgi:hypothetical protein